MKRTLLITGVVALFLTATTVLHAKEITVRGKLQKTAEAGGWLIAGRDAKYLILNAKNFQSNGWFKESTNVEAVGETKDVMTTFMEGTPFEAKSMKPVEEGEQNTATPGRDDNRRVTRVMVAGDSIVQAQPDTAIVTVSVVTQNRQALAAQQDNAAKTDAVVRALKAAAGSGAEVKTSGYSVQPQRVYKEGQPPTITGYEARNSVTVTLSDLTKVGSVIDAAAQAGANDVAGISFTLRQDRQARDRALSEATREAVSKAQVIASALGGRVVRIVEVQEEGFQQRPPVPVYQYESMQAKSGMVATPVEIGSLDISSRVQVIAEVETNM
ncbi:MAG TPA: SIMPL domain-containing protein [Pyrinomonadaceae bacterium]|nr:SIMPL domain-containing protein [Pyrinomonadaceae bacterium]